MIYIDEHKIRDLFSYDEFIPYLKDAFSQSIEVPQRQHYSIPVLGKKNATLLLMPAWQQKQSIGIKIVTVFPENSLKNIPTIQGSYLLMSASDGVLSCNLDAKELTAKRTAAASALASQFLSKRNSTSLLMVGTGTLCHELIRAHCCIRPINEVWIWGRNFEKAIQKSKTLSLDGVTIEAVKDLERMSRKADIISCATLSKDPLILGEWVQQGTHIDLVGSFTPDAREVDDFLVSKAKIFIDTESAKQESGDIFQPLQNATITEKDILGDLSTLCESDRYRRASQNDITLFKSVGYALEDLAAATYLYEKYQKKQQ